MMAIDTLEKVQKPVETFEAAERRGLHVPKHDEMKEIEEGRKIMEEYFAKCRAEREIMSNINGSGSFTDFVMRSILPDPNSNS